MKVLMNSCVLGILSVTISYGLHMGVTLGMGKSQDCLNVVSAFITDSICHHVVIVSEECRSLSQREQALVNSRGEFMGSYHASIDIIGGNPLARGHVKINGYDGFITAPLTKAMLSSDDNDIVIYGDKVYADYPIYLFMEIWSINGEQVSRENLIAITSSSESIKSLQNGEYAVFGQESESHCNILMKLNSKGTIEWKHDLSIDVSSWRWSFDNSTIFLQPHHEIGSIRGMYENHLPKPILGTLSNKGDGILVEELSEYKFKGPFDFISNELIAQVRYNKWYIIQANPSSRIISEGVLSFVPSKSSSVIAWNDESQFVVCSREDASLVRIELVNVGEKKSEYSVSIPFIDDGDPFKVLRVKPNQYRVYSKNKSVVVEVQEISCRHE